MEAMILAADMEAVMEVDTVEDMVVMAVERFVLSHIIISFDIRLIDANYSRLLRK